MNLIHRILIILDDSPLSEKVVDFGYLIARQLQAKTALLYVDNYFELPVDTIVPYDTIYTEESRVIKGKHFLERMQQQYSQGIETRIFVREGEIKDTVLFIAGKWGAHMIVAGTHARKGINKIIRGSVSEKILHDAKIPMLIVPADNAG